MINIEEIDRQLYGSQYGIPTVGNYDEIWNSIKNKDEILRESIKVVKNKFGYDTVNGLAICDSMLVDFNSVNKEIYMELIKLIYTNKAVARIVVDGYQNGGYSFLLMTLWNQSIELTEEQKAFAVSEAMNKIGTVKCESEREEFSKKLDEHGITNEDVTTIEIGNTTHPIGAKAKAQHMNNLFGSLGNEQAHGTGEFDIRYWILNNPNWTEEEKQKLVYDFYSDAEEYDECLEQWEWNIINDKVNYRFICSYLDKELLYDYEYDDLLRFYESKDVTDRIWKEIEFCKLMHKLRPQQWELKLAETQKLVLE